MLYEVITNFYDINGNFKDILLDVSNIGGQSRYILSYHSQQDLESLEIELEIHYARNNFV